METKAVFMVTFGADEVVCGSNEFTSSLALKNECRNEGIARRASVKERY